MEASQHGLYSGYLGELVTQLAACVTECESFLSEQLDAFERLERQLSASAVKRCLHPHHDDPVVAAVLAELSALHSTLDREAGQPCYPQQAE